MQIVFRKSEKTDTLIYRKIRLECLQIFPDKFGSTWAEESRIEKLKFEILLENESADDFMFGSFDGENLIGICGFSRADRDKTKHRGEIVQMYVNPKFAGQNVGFRLLQKTIEKAFENPQIEQIILSVVARNEGANRLYEKLGFAEYGYLEIISSKAKPIGISGL